MKKLHFIILAAFALLVSPLCAKENAPKKQGKPVFIEYKDGTTIKATTWKGKFVEGPIDVKFRDGSEIQGEYLLYNNRSLITGSMYPPKEGYYTKYINAIYIGVFCIANDGTEFLPKKSKTNWAISVGMTGMKIENEGCTVYARLSDNLKSFNVTTITPDRRVDSITFIHSMSNVSWIITKNANIKKYEMLHVDPSFFILQALKNRSVAKTVYFHNGDVYTGQLTSFFPINADIAGGRYQYQQGGEITGKFDSNFNPLSGVIMYANGKSETFTKFWPSLSSAQIKNLLFTKRESLENITQLNAQERLRIEEEKRQEEKRIAEAKHQEELRIAKEKQQKEQEEQQKEQQARHKEEVKRQGYISKYGYKWGDLVYKKKLTVGMTKAMVSDIVDLSWYDKSVSSQFGTTFEVYSFNKDKADLKLASKAKDASDLLALAFIDALSEEMGVSNYGLCQFLEFTNGRLTSIIQ